MEVIIKGEPKEIAALAVAVQERHGSETHIGAITQKVIQEIADGLKSACDTLPGIGRNLEN